MPRPNNIAALSVASAYAFDAREASQVNSFAEQEFQAYLAKNFAEDWRVNDNTTLFDYRPGTTTAFFTDRSFPRVHMNISQMNAQSREQARQRCAQMGVPADEMGGCIFDQGYLNIAPNVPPTPNVPNPTGTVLNKVERPALNNNAHTFAEGKYPPNRPETIGKPGTTVDKPNSDSKENSTSKPSQATSPAINRGASNEPMMPREPKPSSPTISKPSAPVAPRPSAPVAPRPSAPSPSTPKPSVPAIKSGKG
jgi:hypothetical protein